MRPSSIDNEQIIERGERASRYGRPNVGVVRGFNKWCLKPGTKHRLGVFGSASPYVTILL